MCMIHVRWHRLGLPTADPGAGPRGRDGTRRRNAMMTTPRSGFAAASVGAALLLAATPGRLSAQQAATEAVHIGNSDLGGVVMGENGPEAGVWVIAETNGLPTPF